jgi:predicted enzyme related to lactoylglutathione lyase
LFIRATSPSTSTYPDVEAALAKAESLGGTRVMGPEKVMESIEIGLFHDPEGHLVGVVNPEM